MWSLRGRPLQRRFEPLNVTVIIAVRNGEHYLAAKLESILRLEYPKDRLDVLVVSDGSTDSTDAIAQGFRDLGVAEFLVVDGFEQGGDDIGHAATLHEDRLRNCPRL